MSDANQSSPPPLLRHGRNGRRGRRIRRCRHAPRAQSSATAASVPAIKPGTHTSFEALKQVKAGVLDIGYAEAGTADGPVVLLLHGWPYDIHSFVDVAPLLAAAGYRVIVPYLRGYGTTRFLVGRDAAQRPAVSARRRYDRAAGCAGHREGDHCRLRLGRADRQYHGGALARALQGHGICQRLSDRQPGGEQEAACRRKPNLPGGTSSISPPNAAVWDTRATRTISPS